MVFGIDLTPEELEKLRLAAKRFGYKSTKQFIQDALENAIINGTGKSPTVKLPKITEIKT